MFPLGAVIDVSIRMLEPEILRVPSVGIVIGDSDFSVVSPSLFLMVSEVNRSSPSKVDERTTLVFRMSKIEEGESVSAKVKDPGSGCAGDRAKVK